MYVLSIKVPIQKKSGNLFHDTRIKLLFDLLKKIMKNIDNISWTNIKNKNYFSVSLKNFFFLLTLRTLIPQICCIGTQKIL